jgi:hypothetical protein
MILLDTNVVSEALRPKPSSIVAAWLRTRPATELFTTTITEAELCYSAALLPAGKRQQSLAAAIDRVISELFAGRVLPFDSAAAREYADIAAARHRAGRPISPADAQIAAIARSRGAGVATRNVEDFDDCGIRVVNPWDS